MKPVSLLRNQHIRHIRYVFYILMIIAFGAYCVNWNGNQGLIFFYFLAIGLAFYFSRNRVFWLALFFIMICAPFGLFYSKDAWMFTLTPTVGMGYYVYFIFICYLKSLKVKQLSINNFKRFYKPVWYYALFLIIPTFIYGINIRSVFLSAHSLPSLILFVAVPIFLQNKKDILLFNKVLLFFSIIITVHSIADLFYSGSITRFIFHGWPELLIDVDQSGLIRYTGGISICLYTMIVSLYYIVSNKKVFKTYYLWLVVILSYFYIFNSATRGWMLAGGFILFSFAFLQSKSFLKYSVLILIIIISLFYLMPSSAKNNIYMAWARLKTLEAMVKGDLTAEGTLSRLTVRSSRVMSQVVKNPITGFGYSDVTFQYWDGHVAHQSLLLVGGIIGMIILYSVLIAICAWIIKQHNLLNEKSLIVFVIGFAGIMIIQSSSRGMISYLMPPDQALLISLIFAQINIIINSKRQLINDKYPFINRRDVIEKL